MPLAIVQPLESRTLFVGIAAVGTPVDAGASGNLSVLYGTVPIGEGNFLAVVGQGDALLARILGPTGNLIRNTFPVSAPGFKVDNFAGIDLAAMPNNRVMFSYSYFRTDNVNRDVAVTQLDTNGDILFTTTPAPGGGNETLSHIAIATHSDGSTTAGISYKFFADNNTASQSRIALSTIDAGTGSILVPQVVVSTPTGGEQDTSNDIAAVGSSFFVGYRRDLFGQTGADTSFFSARVVGQTVSPEVRLFLQTAAQGGTFGDIFVTPTPTGINAFFDRGLGPTFANPNQPKSSEIFFVPVTPTDTTQTVATPSQFVLAATGTQVIPVQVEPLGTGANSGSSGSVITIRLTSDNLNTPAQNRLIIAGPTGTILSDNTIGTSTNSSRTAIRGSTGLLLQTTQSQGFTFFTAQPLNVTQPLPPVQNVVVSIGVPQFNERVTEALFPISLSAAADAPITLMLATREPPTGTAIPGLDYSAKTQTITIPAGATSATFIVNRDVDRDSEGKTFDVDLTLISGPASPGTLISTATIPARKLISYLMVVNVLAELFSTSQSLDTGGLLTPNRTAAPKLSGTVTLTASPEAGGDAVTIGTQKIASASNTKPTKLKVKGKAPAAPGQYTLSATFSPDSKSGVSANDVSVSVTTPQGNDATITVERTAKNGLLLLTGDNDGTAVAISFKGPGSATLVNTGLGTQDLILTGTTSATKLTINLSPLQPDGNDKRFNVRNILSDSPIGSVSAAAVDVSGNIFLGGPISKGSFGNVKDQPLITLGAGSVPATLSFLSLQNVTFTSGQPIKSLTVREWLDTDSTPDLLSAPSIDKLISTGNFEAGLNVSGNVKSLAVSAILGGSTLHTLAAANFGAVSANSVRNTQLFAGVASTSLPTSPAGFTASPSAIASFTLKGTGFSNTSIAARTIGKVLIKGVVPANPTPFGISAITLAAYTNGPVKRARITTPTVIESVDAFSVATL